MRKSDQFITGTVQNDRGHGIFRGFLLVDDGLGPQAQLLLALDDPLWLASFYSCLFFDRGGHAKQGVRFPIQVVAVVLLRLLGAETRDRKVSDKDGVPVQHGLALIALDCDFEGGVLHEWLGLKS